MATPIVSTGMLVEIMPVPIPLMMTVAGPVWADARRETTDDGETEAYPVVEAETIKDEERGEGNQHSAGIGADG